MPNPQISEGNADPDYLR